MKLLIVTCLKEYLADISQIFKQANIDVFSTSDIIGHRDSRPENILEDWFASGGEQADSMMIFTFTSEANVQLAMGLITDYNKNLKESFPARAFVLDVEKSIDF
jgi:hypothetical protein